MEMSSTGDEGAMTSRISFVSGYLCGWDKGPFFLGSGVSRVNREK